jgi:hypothetical protein
MGIGRFGVQRPTTTSTRQFIASCLAASAFPLTEACSNTERPPYENAVTEMTNPIAPLGARDSGGLRDLVRQATLAASSHNTQPWKFRLAERSITILPDFSRRTPIVDPDDHHLFVSLGCATENLVHAALATGLRADVRIGDDDIAVAFDETTPARSPLFEAVPVRQCSRSIYDGHPLAANELHTLENVAQGEGVHAIVMTAAPQIETVLDYVTRGNAAQLADRAFVDELKTWIGFNEAEAVRTRDGLFSRTTGNPTIPRWLGTRLLGTLLTPKSENDKCAKQLRSSAGVVVFVSDANERRHWIEVGRSYERFALQATALGIRTALLNQPVEVAPLRAQFAPWLNVGSRRPDLVVRFGRGPEMPPSLRRPIEQVLV